MTESPINLDEAYRSIDSGRHKQIRSVRTEKWEVLIEGDYLESIVNELVASRARIAELEGKITGLENTMGNYSTLRDETEQSLINARGSLHDIALAEITLRKRAELKLANAIIPQADDARYINAIIKFLSSENEGEWDDALEFLLRYLAAIEGGKQ